MADKTVAMLAVTTAVCLAVKLVGETAALKD